MAEINIKKINRFSGFKENIDKITDGETGALIDYVSVENKGEDLTSYHLTQTQSALALKINELIDEYGDNFEGFNAELAKIHIKTNPFLGFLFNDPVSTTANPLHNYDWYVNVPSSSFKMWVGGLWQVIGANKGLQTFDTVTAFEAGTRENELALLKVKVDPLDPASKEELFVAVKHKKTDGTYEVIQYATKEYIDRQIKGTGTSLKDVIDEAQVNLEGLQKEIEFMNDGGKTELGGPGFELKEKQDKLRDDQFIETAPVDFIDISAISSAAGIATDLSGIKKDVNALKAKDTNLEGTLNGLQKKVDNLATNTVITTIEKKADANTAAIAALATNPAITAVTTKAAKNETELNQLKQKEQNDINKVNTDLTAAQAAINTKIAAKADKTVTDALTGRVGKNENDISDLKTKSSTQASTVTSHTTKIGALETTVGNQAGTLQTHGTQLTGHQQGIAKNVEDIKDLKNLASFMGIYVPSSFPHTTTASEIKTHFGAAKLGMFSFVKSSSAGDNYEIWTAEAITVGGVPQATGDWVHETGADITINMKPYLAMKMKADLSGQEPPTVKGQVIYGNTLDPQDNKWTNLTEVLKDAYEAKLVSANKGKLMTIVNTGTDAAPVWDIAFEEPALQGTDLLMEATGGWSAGYTPQIGDVVVVNEIDADGKIVKLGATVNKAMFGASEEKTPGSGIWTAKTDSKDKMVVGGDNTTKLVYIDNPDFTALGTDTRPRIWTFRNSDTKGGWQPLDEAEINGKANFVGTDTGKILVVKAVDATTGNVELEPIALTEADIQKIKDDATALDARVGQNESDILALENLKTDVADLKDTTVPAIDTRVTDVETFKGYFDTAVDGGYVFKTDDTSYSTKGLKDVAADLTTATNFDVDDARLMTESEINTAIKGSLEPRQKELINFQQQKTKPDGTPEYEADGVTPVMIDLGDDAKPVKFTGAKDTALTQASTLATKAAQGVVATTGTDLFVSNMIGKDDDAADGTPGPANDDKKLVSKKYVDEHGMRDVSDLKGEALWNALVADTFYIIKTKTSTTADAISNEKVIIEVHSKDDTAGIQFTAIALDNTFHSTGEQTFAKPAAGNTTDLPEVLAAKVTAAGAATETIIKSKGKVSDYIEHIAKAEAENKLVRFLHELPGRPTGFRSVARAVPVIEHIALSADGKYIIAAAGEYAYVSKDYGDTWFITENTADKCTAIAISSDGSFMAYGRQNGDLKFSTDFGANWITKTLSPVQVLTISADGNYLFVGTNDRKIHSYSKASSSWTEATPSTTSANWVAIATSETGKYVLAGMTRFGVFVSKDFGVTWTINDLRWRTTYSSHVAMSSDGSKMYVGSSGNWVEKSTDFGTTWAAKQSCSKGPIQELVTSPDGKYILARGSSSSGGEVLLSSDFGESWTITKTWRYRGAVKSLAVSGDGQLMFLGTDDESLYSSGNQGATWVRVIPRAGASVDTTAISTDGKVQVYTAGSQLVVSRTKPGPHHQALVHEVDKEDVKVYSSEQGKIIEIGNLQLDGNYHLEIEVDKGTTIPDGTGVGGATTPNIIAPDIPAGPTLTTYTLTFDDGTTQRVKWEQTV